MPDEIQTSTDHIASMLMGHPQMGPIIQLGTRMLEAAGRLPDDEDISEHERELVYKLEAEVDAAFGTDARLYGRAVALYAVRDLLASR